MTDPYIDPTREQFGAFAKLPQDTPIAMLNLVRLRARAAYEDEEVDGRAAYRRYSELSAPVLARVGGQVAWSGGFEAVLIGPEDERWDLVFIARYPNAAAFIEMVRDPEYKQAVRHRTAAVETSRLIRLRPASAGRGFG
ncbi:DUF1330 domain-containing protein [Pontivivens ytuae]|uniref:DUF1330 domain-containing protein n=1 Tax=Pontivivens ytuae TaxID=2789856 RepID=A0A7S9QEF9_9RHOB|nr:DUF1330 domain-containing protein [Pontivivens ytuae]QPH55925.1 DUF1330 domain-containing protein [Pontivivens ytuae]